MVTRPGGREASGTGIVTAAGDIVEVQVPFRSLGLRSGDPVAFIVALHMGTMEIEHHPARRPFELRVPGLDFTSRNWTA